MSGSATNVDKDKVPLNAAGFLVEGLLSWIWDFLKTEVNETFGVAFVLPFSVVEIRDNDAARKS